MELRNRIKPAVQDRLMNMMDDMRPETVAGAEGDVLEVGFGTGLNLRHYGTTVKSVTGLDPMVTEGIEKVDRRIADAPFPVERAALRADGELPFDTGSFDTVITTWTLCSIPEPLEALRHMHRVLKPGGRYIFIEHGRADTARTARWQDRINPIWCKLMDGCNINRPMNQLVEQGGFELTALNRFRSSGPGIAAHMYRGVATRT